MSACTKNIYQRYNRFSVECQDLPVPTIEKGSCSIPDPAISPVRMTTATKRLMPFLACRFPSSSDINSSSSIFDNIKCTSTLCGLQICGAWSDCGSRRKGGFMFHLFPNLFSWLNDCNNEWRNGLRFDTTNAQYNLGNWKDNQIPPSVADYDNTTHTQ